jgi:hypothetical protein
MQLAVTEVMEEMAATDLLLVLMVEMVVTEVLAELLLLQQIAS